MLAARTLFQKSNTGGLKNPHGNTPACSQSSANAAELGVFPPSTCWSLPAKFDVISKNCFYDYKNVFCKGGIEFIRFESSIGGITIHCIVFELSANIFIFSFCVVFILQCVVRQSKQEDVEDVRQTAARSLTTSLRTAPEDLLRATDHKASKRKRECELPKEPIPRKVHTAGSNVTVYRANIYRRAK